MEYKNYIKKGVTEMAPWESQTDMTRVSVSVADKENGSPKQGDMIARSPKDKGDQWLVAKEYFDEHYSELIEAKPGACNIRY